MTPNEFPGVFNPISYFPVTQRVIEPAHTNAFFKVRSLKPYDGWKLSYVMSALTNGPHITSGEYGEVTPKRGVLNNDRALHYVDTNFDRYIKCTAGSSPRMTLSVRFRFFQRSAVSTLLAVFEFFYKYMNEGSSDIDFVI